MNNARLLILACTFVTFSMVANSTYAVVINGFDPNRHDRFLSNGDPNPSFMMDQSLITGLGLARAILITPMHYITAAHAPNSMPSFRGSDGNVHTYQSASSVRLTTNLPGGGTQASDIELHTLTAPTPVADGVTPLAIADGNLGDFVGRSFFVVGANSRAGRNVIEGVHIVEFQSGSSDTVAIHFSYDTASNGGTGGLGADEAGLLGGDSGNPALIQIENEIALIGPHFGISVPPGSSAGSDRYDNFSSMLTPYLSEIESIVANDGQSIRRLSITSVPEPSMGAALIFATVIVCRRRRRLAFDREMP